MSLFVYHGETVDRAGKRIMVDKIRWMPIILIAIAILAIGGVAGYVFSKTGDETGALPPVAATPTGPVSTTPTSPVTSTSPTPAQTQTTVTEPGVVVLTVEELLNQVIANPNRYKEGTVMQLAGLALKYSVGTSVWDLYLGPKVQGWHVDVEYRPGVEGGELADYLISKFAVSNESFPITIRGTLRWVVGKQALIEHAYLVADAK